jgi:HD-like signal output (HDOD) protein
MTEITSPEPAREVSYLKEPLKDLAEWTRYFLEAEIPVLAETAQKLEEYREIEEEVDAGMLADLIDTDPFFTMKVLAYVSARRRNQELTQTETVISSLVMMGVAPFFRNFGPQPTVQDQLESQPAALELVMALIKRARRAAHFATGFAVHRGDDPAGSFFARFCRDADVLLCAGHGSRDSCHAACQPHLAHGQPAAFCFQY